MYRPNLQSVALAVPEIIVIAVLGWDCEPPILGRGGRRRSGMVPFERALATSYRLSIVTFPLSLRVSEILPLLCSSTPLLGGWLLPKAFWATKSEGVGLIDRAISFQDFQPM